MRLFVSGCVKVHPNANGPPQLWRCWNELRLARLSGRIHSGMYWTDAARIPKSGQTVSVTFVDEPAQHRAFAAIRQEGERRDVGGRTRDTGSMSRVPSLGLLAVGESTAHPDEADGAVLVGNEVDADAGLAASRRHELQRADRTVGDRWERLLIVALEPPR